MSDPLRILIVDDDRMTREATRIALATKGYLVVVAENGKSAIELARSNKFDAAIVDLFMPDMDGLQVISTIHAIDPNLPLIAASGFMFGGNSCPQMPNFDGMAAEAGAKATLYKPFRPDALVKKITEVMEAAAASFVSASS
jgi:CheY-like chemotaxis protein